MRTLATLPPPPKVSFLVSFVISSTKNCLYDGWISLLVFEEFFLLHWYFSIVGFAESAMWLITCLVIEDICLLDGWTSLLVFEDVFYFSWICLTTAAIELLCKIVSVAYVTPLVFGQMLITSMIVDTSLPIPLILQKLFMWWAHWHCSVRLWHRADVWLHVAISC